MADTLALPDGVVLTDAGQDVCGAEEILSRDALTFVAELVRTFGVRLQTLLAARVAQQAAWDRGEVPSFRPDGESVRTKDWRIAPLPPDLLDRRVEITGPASDRKMVIHALNSGARIYMTDFEDATAPTWANCLAGQVNVRDAVRRTITYDGPDGRSYRLREKTAVLFVRPRGLHLSERHMEVEGAAVPAALFDFGLFFWHNAHALLEQGTAPYLYLPKLESASEAALWDDILTYAEGRLKVMHGATKATVLIETFPAVFEMHEILYALQNHSAGLNCGRWDYIFSLAKTRRAHPELVLPDRAQVTMAVRCMRAYTQLAIQTCHRRGAPCIGGMAAQIPVRDDPVASAEAFALVRADKIREATEGHDGTWVAHPGLVPGATEIFDRYMPGPNQMDRLREDIHVTAADLLSVPEGTITEDGVRTNVSVFLQYVAAWLSGHGAVPIRGLMEDAATAEISRVQLWQWARHPRGCLEDGRDVTAGWIGRLIEEEGARLRRTLSASTGAWSGPEPLAEAQNLLAALTARDTLAPFFTTEAYDLL